MSETIRAVEAAAYEFPTDEPEGDGTLTWASTTMVAVTVRAAGEAGTGWTYAPAAAAAFVTSVLADVVRGRDALAPESSQDAMVRAVRNAGRPGLVAMAISAVDIALWDLCAKLHDLPLWQLWGAEPRPTPVYGSGGFTTYDDARLRSQVEAWLTLGMSAVKIKIGESWGTRQSRDLQRTELVRTMVGDDVSVFVDANGGYQIGQARRVGRRLDDLGITWFEEPVSSDNLAGLRRLRDSVGADVTAGEYGYDLPYFQRMCAAEAVDCLQIDVTRCGGYTEWRRIAAVAAAHNLEVSGHCAPYLTNAVAAATPGLRHLEWFHDHARISQLFVNGFLEPRDGALSSSSAPGHGMSLRTKAAERHRVA